MSMMTHVDLAPDRLDVRATEDTANLDGILCGLTSIDGWTNGPGIRRQRTDRLWAHGEFSERGWRTARLITITGHIRTTTRAEAAALVDELASVYADGTTGRFTFSDPDLGTRWADVALEGTPKTDWDRSTRIDFQMQLLAADPRKYGQAITGSTGVPVDGGGLGYDLYTVGSTGVLDYGAAGSPGIVSLTNAGTADTAPIHTITGSCPSGFTITELGTGRRLVYAGTVISGQVIRLDSADGSVMLDDDGDRGAQLVRREWLRLGKRQTGTWLFEAPGSTNAQLQTEVAPAWW